MPEIPQNSEQICIYVRIYASMYVSMYLCTYLCSYVRIYVSMYVSMCLVGVKWGGQRESGTCQNM